MYDFKSLSAYDFEILVRDLLQKHLGIFLESFKSGRDQGIDLRYAPAKDQSLIVQCKHYAGTGYSGLFVALKKEVVKVKRLSPMRYFVATSVPLSLAEKKEIHHLFEPFCRATQDIFGLEDINNLLGQFPDIERKHFKLWLTSTTVLERIVHSALYNQTAIIVEQIQNKAKLYVQNESFFEAQKVLKEYNYCVISGIPGIGKTFLGEILLLQYVSNGYEPVVVRTHIREAFSLLNVSTKQVFYYDDFLGQTGWEDKLEKNEEQSILDFVKYIRTHKHARFILTTREYILQQAKNIYEKLHASDFDHAKCLIRLESYNRRDRAHILFNHVYFSALPRPYKESLAQKSVLLSIVDHKNYSPRIVEWMSDYQNLRDCTDVDYPKRFIDTLDNPSELWRHAFRNHLTPPSRGVLLVMMTFRSDVVLADLKDAFESFRIQEAKLFGVAITPNEFMTALNELEGTFIRCERDKHEVVVAFHNPSVRDFLEKYLAENAEILRILCSSIIFYDQFRALCTIRPGKEVHEHFSHVLRTDTGLITEAMIRTVSRTSKGKRLYKNADGTFMHIPEVQTTIEQNIGHALKVVPELPYTHQKQVASRLLDMVRLRIENGEGNLGYISEPLNAALPLDVVASSRTAVAEAAARRFEDIEEYDELNDIIALMDFICAAPGATSSALIERVGAKIKRKADAIFDYDISEANNEDDIEDLRDVARKMEEVFNITLDSIYERLDSKEEELRDRFDGDPDEDYERGAHASAGATDEEILSMFGSLLE